MNNCPKNSSQQLITLDSIMVIDFYRERMTRITSTTSLTTHNNFATNSQLRNPFPLHNSQFVLFSWPLLDFIVMFLDSFFSCARRFYLFFCSSQLVHDYFPCWHTGGYLSPLRSLTDMLYCSCKTLIFP
jgi:hypothetical protein